MCILNKLRGVFIYVKILLTDLKQENIISRDCNYVTVFQVKAFCTISVPSI